MPVWAAQCPLPSSAQAIVTLLPRAGLLLLARLLRMLTSDQSAVQGLRLMT